jgi:hypothetical protein
LTQETTAPSKLAPRPAAIFRSALADAAARERASRPRRGDRIRAIAGLTDGDLARLAEEFEGLLHAANDPSAMAERLQLALRALAPEAPLDEEAGDA